MKLTDNTLANASVAPVSNGGAMKREWPHESLDTYHGAGL
jgi:hypothetical protein